MDMLVYEGSINQYHAEEYVKHQTPAEPDDDFHVASCLSSAGWLTDPVFCCNPKPPTSVGGVCIKA